MRSGVILVLTDSIEHKVNVIVSNRGIDLIRRYNSLWYQLIVG